MYKDKEQQKQANKAASQRRRDKSKGMTQGITLHGYDGKDIAGNFIPKPTHVDKVILKALGVELPNEVEDTSPHAVQSRISAGITGVVE